MKFRYLNAFNVPCRKLWVFPSQSNIHPQICVTRRRSPELLATKGLPRCTDIWDPCMEAAGALLATPKVPKQLISGWKCVDGSASDLRGAMSKESHVAMPVIFQTARVFFYVLLTSGWKGRKGRARRRKRTTRLSRRRRESEFMVRV